MKSYYRVYLVNVHYVNVTFISYHVTFSNYFANTYIEEIKVKMLMLRRQ